jgi:hypothetical protein
MSLGNCAEFWYRHESDPGPIRTHPQMSAGAIVPEDAIDDARELKQLGYDVQRVVFLTLCDVCQGQGRIQWQPRTKRGFATYTDCRLCNGDGALARAELPLTLI